MFDVFYLGDECDIKEHIPFAKKITRSSDIRTRTKMYWLIDSDAKINDFGVFDYRPDDHEQKYEHVWSGGLRLVPRKRPQGIKKHEETVAKRKIDVLYTKTPGDYFERNPDRTRVWCVDPDYKITENISWEPDEFEPNFIHNFHLRDQLYHKYPEEEGGVNLYPRNWQTADIKYRGDMAETLVRYPVYRVPDPTTYQPDHACWVVDELYNITDIDMIPWENLVEQEMVHVYHVRGQLNNKYTESMGGVYWYPGTPGPHEFKIHAREALKVEVREPYPVYRVADPADQNPDHACWMIDENYVFQDPDDIIPWQNAQERDMIHVYHVEGQLKRKYPEKMGGVYWYPGNQNSNTDTFIHTQELKPDDDILLDQYPVYSVDDPADQNPSYACWMVDKDYILSKIVQVPWQHPEEKGMIHVFQVRDQLKHKYPEAMGGVYWYPDPGYEKPQVYIHKEFVRTQILVQEVNLDGNSERKIHAGLFPIFHDEDTGRAECETDWFWVVDPNVVVLPDFDFSYVPEVWDQGKKHAWQVVNPKTGLHYDYAGVTLCPKVLTKNRTKYIMEHASTHKEYPIYRLDAYKDPIKQLEKWDAETENDMYWVIDPFVEVVEDFMFDWYPTQWDNMHVHVFMREHDEEHMGLRLIPKGTFQAGKHNMLIEDVYANRFSQLKYMQGVSVRCKEWPVERFEKQTLDELKDILAKHQDSEFVFTIDEDAEIHPDFADKLYLPEPAFVDRIHMWQRTNPHTGQVHSYGGLRLWPTNTDTSKLTTSAIQNNKFRNRRYVRELGAVYHEYDVVFITYKEDPELQLRHYDILSDKMDNSRFDRLKRVHGVDGIFEAHKMAAELAESKMFWVVDGDAQVVPDFDFSYMPETYDQETVHVWHSENPLTGDTYGYGGVKLFNREQVLNATSWGLDFTTGLSTRFKVIPEVACITRFNTSAFDTWRAAFREAVKLTVNGDAESQERLARWLDPEITADHALACIAGARAGIQYAEENMDNQAALGKINDYEFVKFYWETYERV